MPTYPDMVHFHPDQGMTNNDIAATLRVAARRNEIIIFRDTGRWSRPYIDAGHPTKPFHVKGKSSDWGPQAGLVPLNSEFSKAFQGTEVAKGQAYNRWAVARNRAIPVRLFVAPDFIAEHLMEPAGSRGNKPIDRIAYPRDGVAYFFCTKPNDEASKPGKPYVLLGKKQLDGRYEIFHFPLGMRDSAERQLFLKEGEAEPLLVLTTPGGDSLPITGDYDMFAVCPSHGQFGRDDMKMDPTLDYKPQNDSFKRTQAKALGPAGHTTTMRAQQSLSYIKAARTGEDPERGNLTPRIARLIDSLIKEMGGKFPRLHHNAESGRPSAPPLEEGMPLTTFHPRRGIGGYPFLSAVITNQSDLHSYFTAIYSGGYYPPRNAGWKMAHVKDISAAQAAFRTRF